MEDCWVCRLYAIMSCKTNRIVCRADANAAIGRGHLSRLLALARMLSDRFPVFFISLEASRSYCSTIHLEFPHIFIATETELADHLMQNDILVLDGYAFEAVQMAMIKRLVRGIVYIDDFCSVPDYADMIVNHTPGITVADYAATDAVRFCVGLDYCLVQPDLFNLRQRLNGAVPTEGVLVCFGGADPMGLCEQFVKALLVQGFRDPIVAVGRLPGYLAAATNVNHVESIDQTNLAHLMLAARVVLLTASVVAFEAAVLRCAMFLVYYTENQAANYRGMLEQGIAAGGGRIVNAKDISIAVGKFMALYGDESALEQLRHCAAVRIDGHAGERIVSAIEALVSGS